MNKGNRFLRRLFYTTSLTRLPQSGKLQPPINESEDRKNFQALLRFRRQLFYLCFILEDEGDGVEAVAEVGWCRAVVEDVAEVTSAAGAEDLGTYHAQGDITDFRDVFGGKRTVEAGPPGAGVKLRAGGEEWQSAAGAEVNAILVVIQQIPAEGGLGALGPQHAIGGRTKLLLPLGIGLHDEGTLNHWARLTIEADKADGHGMRVTCGTRGGLC